MAEKTLEKTENNNDYKKKSIIEIILDYVSRTSPGLLFLHLIWIIIAVGMLSVSYIVAFHFTSVLSIYREAHDVRNFDNNLRLSVSQDETINSMLTELLNDLLANRAYLARYHNGIASVSGIPFISQSITHEVIRPGTPRLMLLEQRIPASLNIFPNRFAENICSTLNRTLTARDNQNIWFLQSHNSNAMIRCPIFMPNGDLFGYVGIDYSDNLSIDELNLLSERVKEAAVILPSYFINSRR